DVVGFGDSLGAALVNGLDEKGFSVAGDGELGLTGRDLFQVSRRPRDPERRRRDAVEREGLFGFPLVQAKRQGIEVAARVWDAEEFANRGNVSLAIHAVEAFGEVEDDVGTSGAKTGGEVFVRLEADDFSDLGQRVFDGVDGF